MRPVNKGEVPQKIYMRYQDAELDLEERLGAYCSFCEFCIQHVPEVEHREAKSAGGEALKWENLLLSCKYCNTRKSDKVKLGDKEKHLWPDEDDTFHAFSYQKDVPELNEAYLRTLGEESRSKAENLYNLIKLDNIPISPTDKDRRYRSRSEARNSAKSSKDSWERVKNSSYKEDFFEQTIKLALATGFFSVWMEVFKEDTEVREGLIKAFKGTKKEYCSDAQG